MTTQRLVWIKAFAKAGLLLLAAGAVFILYLVIGVAAQAAPESDWVSFFLLRGCELAIVILLVLAVVCLIQPCLSYFSKWAQESKMITSRFPIYASCGVLLIVVSILVVPTMIDKYGGQDSATMLGLMDAIVKDQPIVIEQFLREGGDPNSRFRDSMTLLMLTSIHGKLEVARLLVEKGADINARDKQGKTALMYAAGSGKDMIVRYLLENNVLTRMRDKENRSARDWAIRLGRTGTADILDSSKEF